MRVAMSLSWLNEYSSVPGVSVTVNQGCAWLLPALGGHGVDLIAWTPDSEG